ncbi:hypothetical protein [Phocaeicola vulgatus]|uniref:hypothetical protein n=1 Tax=Phocaeicola vulgatus TaxID=821 RepID=UPI001F1D0834|nr:hypothetical protein [Phocaeicola vulgatus]
MSKIEEAFRGLGRTEKVRFISQNIEYANAVAVASYVKGYLFDVLNDVGDDEYNAIRDAVQYVTNKHDFGYFIQPWKDEFLRMPFDVTKRKKWADYVAECHATGKEIDYDNYDWDK